MSKYEILGKPRAISIGLPALHPLRLTLRSTTDHDDTATVVVFFTPDAWSSLKEYERTAVVNERVAPLLALPRDSWTSSAGWTASGWPDVDYENTVETSNAALT